MGQRLRYKTETLKLLEDNTENKPQQRLYGLLKAVGEKTHSKDFLNRMLITQKIISRTKKPNEITSN